MTTLMLAQIISSHGKSYVVECKDGATFIATNRGKKGEVVCGDWVDIQILNKEQAVIENLHPRQTLLYRSDRFRSKQIAANVTQTLIVVAAKPSFSDELLARSLIASSAAHIKAFILLNKNDLPETAEAKKKLQFYQDLGYPLLSISAKKDISALLPILEGETSVLVGQSGMGKSSLLNAFIPEARARVNEISYALNSGKHTTTHARLYHLDSQSHLIDAPGLQQFGLYHIPKEELIYYMPDLAPYIGQCRFHNCQHHHEPDCAIHHAIKDHKIAPLRLALLLRLQEEYRAKK